MDDVADRLVDVGQRLEHFSAAALPWYRPGHQWGVGVQGELDGNRVRIFDRRCSGFDVEHAQFAVGFAAGEPVEPAGDHLFRVDDDPLDQFGHDLQPGQVQRFLPGRLYGSSLGAVDDDLAEVDPFGDAVGGGSPAGGVVRLSGFEGFFGDPVERVPLVEVGGGPFGELRSQRYPDEDLTFAPLVEPVGVIRDFGNGANGFAALAFEPVGVLLVVIG